MNPITIMSRFFEKHPNAYYSLIVVILLAMNIFSRWRNGDDWMDNWLFSVLSTAILSVGLIYGDKQRRKKQAERQERERRLREKEQAEEQE
ncbi:MAG: hypothetical protein Q4D36_05325 [Bacteroidales bacterium]|nr:hypothetical protein [Bacteroidales bacterium]